MKTFKFAVLSVLLAIQCVGLTGCFVPGVTLNGRFTEELDLSFDAVGINRLEADTTNGDIVLSATDSAEIKVHVVKTIRAISDEKAEEYAAQVVVNGERSGDLVKIDYDQPKGWKNIQVNISYTIDCPPALDVNLGTSNGNVNITGIEKSVEANTTNGTIHLIGGQGTNRLRSTNGNVHTENSTGMIDASTTNGSITAQLNSLEANSDFSTTNGNVRVQIEKGSASLRASSTNGSVTISIPSDFKGQLDAGTSNGHVSSDFAIPVTKPSKNSLKGPIGDGGDCTLYLRTTNGNVEVKKTED